MHGSYKKVMRIFSRQSKGPIRRARYNLEYIIKTGLKEICIDGVNCIHLNQVRGQ